MGVDVLFKKNICSVISRRNELDIVVIRPLSSLYFAKATLRVHVCLPNVHDLTMHSEEEFLRFLLNSVTPSVDWNRVVTSVYWVWDFVHFFSMCPEPMSTQVESA